ncbi:DUF2491 family protein [Pseudomonas sp. 148P]|uniref:DUF2491 family protein n=1 Tax=Pseudomonas ulcerans TaxID=3115852 RepID=A0ABU7HNU1_9PSED|nr:MULTISPECIES: DUF2491 family protein [unclassified Pseudomonas]MEE1926182.1 DUF2491 family protein [Pseudomonas sp. 147P]MEE1933200.1 DUF2491 family protein [Pseudomonas sp. 148P]
MSWIKRMLGLQAPLPAARGTAPAQAPEAPLGLASGRMLCLDKHLPLLLADASTLVLPGDEKVWACGTLDLGQGTRLERFYLDDEDYFLQVVMHGNAAEDIEDIILFGYHQVTPINSRDELLRLTGPQSPIGLPGFELDGIEYQRQWGSEDGQTELVPMQEQVCNPETRYRVRHHSMLYARDIELVNRREFLLFSVEEDEEGNVALSTAVGITLQLTDITVI